MNRPDNKLESQFNTLGVYTVDKDSTKGVRALSLLVQIGFPKEAPLSCPDFDIKVRTKRGVETHFTNFDIRDTDTQKVLQFEVVQAIPHDFELMVPTKHYMTFIDFCWYSGNEMINDDIIPDVFTELMPGYTKADLGWYLPSRFVDSILNSMGKLNDVFLSGTLEDAILYGPTLKEVE